MAATSKSALTQTNWDLIRDAASDSTTAKSSLERVTRRSWPAIYAFIRASGRPPEQATELTQGFLCDVFLARKLLEKADRNRGRFRTLLLGAVRNYLADIHRRTTAMTRMPRGGVAPLDQLITVGIDPVAHGADSPERAFNARFVAGLIRSAAERLQQELLSEGDEASWEIFRLRVLQYAFDGTTVGYEEIAPRFGLARGTCAAKLLVAKRRFASILMDEMRATVENPSDLSAEVDELLSLLGSR